MKYNLIDVTGANGDLTYLLSEDGKSTAMVYYESDREVYICNLAVHESARGQGRAKDIIQAAEDLARSRGYTRSTLRCFGSLVGLYERLGYKPSLHLWSIVKNHDICPDKLYSMEKDLTVF